MAKVDDIRARFGSQIAESMGVNRTQRNGAGGVAVEEKPDRFEGTERFAAARMIEVARIKPDPDQPRTIFDPTEIDRLAQSLADHGQLQPISVRWSESLGHYLVVVGERRYQASLQAGRRMIAAVVIENNDPSKILEMQLIENCLREDLQPIEQARAFRRLMDRNEWSALRLGQALKMSESTIIKTLALLTLPCTVQDQVKSGEIAPSVAYEIAKLDDANDQQAVADRVVSEGLNRSETVDVVRQVAKSKPTGTTSKGKGGATKGKPKVITSRTFRGEGGLRIVAERAKGIDLAALIGAMESAVEVMRGELAEAR